VAVIPPDPQGLLWYNRFCVTWQILAVPNHLFKKAYTHREIIDNQIDRWMDGWMDSNRKIEIEIER